MSRSENVDLIQDGLVSQLRAKRAEVERYLLVVGVRRRRLVTVTIFAAAISTLLTALAALWGEQLARLFSDTFGTATDGWRCSAHSPQRAH
jgi:hypothetical protein